MKGTAARREMNVIHFSPTSYFNRLRTEETFPLLWQTEFDLFDLVQLSFLINIPLVVLLNQMLSMWTRTSNGNNGNATTPPHNQTIKWKIKRQMNWDIRYWTINYGNVQCPSVAIIRNVLIETLSLRQSDIKLKWNPLDCL